jgi:hypothetical protein
MSPVVHLDPIQAGDIVRARLGRDPQDMLEAAVVLEAWGGMEAEQALRSGRALVRATPSPQLVSVSSAMEDESQPGFAWEAVAFIVAIMAIAWWTAPLSDALGIDTVQRALEFALPATLALQWGLGSRYLSRAQGIAQLGRHRRALIAATVAIVVVPWVAVGAVGALAGLLTVTWTCGVVLIRRRWAAAYVLIVLLATGGMLLDLPAVAVIVATATTTVAVVVLALATLGSQAREPVGRWSRTLISTAIGGGLGAMLIADPSLHWTAGSVPAIALLPSTLAGLWSGYHLWQFQRALVSSLLGRPVVGNDVSALRSAPLRILGGAVARFVVSCTLLSAALVAGVSWWGDGTVRISILVGFGLIALGTLLLSFLMSVGRPAWALVAVATGLVAELATWLGGIDDQLAGGSLIVGGACLVAIALPAAAAALWRPEATLATTLWIL